MNHRGDRDRLRAAYFVFGVLLVLFLFLIVGLYLIVLDDRAQGFVNRETGYKNRAESCKTQVLLGASASLSENCREPAVLQWYDPNLPPSAGANSAGQQRNLRLQCEQFRREQTRTGVPLPDDCAVSASPPPG